MQPEKLHVRTPKRRSITEDNTMQRTSLNKALPWRVLIRLENGNHSLHAAFANEDEARSFLESMRETTENEWVMYYDLPQDKGY
jgi:hypothetical protein